MRPISKRIACLCLLLTFWSAMAFAAHQHSASADSATCTVCIAAHSASPKPTTTLPKVTFVSVSVFRPEPLATKQRLVVFALCVRPPPCV
jgi:outer membrane lipoprotein-sorting protein